jgi:hypothetical protein
MNNYDARRLAGPEDGKVVICRCDCGAEFLGRPEQREQDPDLSGFHMKQCANCRRDLCDGCPTKNCSNCSDPLCESCSRDGLLCAACVWIDANDRPLDPTAKLVAAMGAIQ